MKRLMIAVLFLLISSVAVGGNIPTTFYVDPTAGDDSNTGLATDNAWKTVSKVNAFSRSNLLRQSEAIGTSPWNNTNDPVISTDNIVAPDGTMTAERIDQTKTNSQSYNGTTGVIPTDNNPVSLSLYIKNGDAVASRIDIRVQGGTNLIYSRTITWADNTVAVTGGTAAGATSTFTPIGDGWFRLTITGNNNGTNNEATIYIYPDVSGETTKYIYAWGAQIELGSVTPYVPTTTAAVTASFQPGDSILFKRGEALGLVVPSSGTASAPITFGMYGTGATPVFCNMNGKTGVILPPEMCNLYAPPFPLFPRTR